MCKPRYLRWLLKKAVSVVHRWTVLWSCTNRIISIECTCSAEAESFIVMIGGKEQTLLSPLVHLALTKCYLTSPTEAVGKLFDSSAHCAQPEIAPIFKWNDRNKISLPPTNRISGAQRQKGWIYHLLADLIYIGSLIIKNITRPRHRYMKPFVRALGNYVKPLSVK